MKDTAIIGAAGIALAGARGVTGNLVLARNTNTVRADASAATLKAVAEDLKKGGDANVEASDDSKQVVLAGGLNVGLSTGAGASIVSLTSNKTVEALLGSATAYGDVKLNAVNKDDLFELALNVAGSGNDAVGIGAAIQSLGSGVSAKSYGDIEAITGGFELKANNNTDMINSAVALAASGSKAASPVGAVTVFNGETNANVESGKTNAKQAVVIAANADKTIRAYTVGAAASNMALSGAVTINSVKDEAITNVAGGVDITAKTLDVTADNDFRVDSKSAAEAFTATAGFAVNAMISVLQGNTVAEMHGTANLTGKANVKAASDRDVVNGVLNVSASGGGAVGVTVMAMTAGAKLDQDAADMLTYGNANEKKEENKQFNVKNFVAEVGARGADTSALKSGRTPSGYSQSSLESDLQGNGRKNSDMKVGSEGKFDAASGYVSPELQDSTGDGAKPSMEESSDFQTLRKLGEGKKNGSLDDVVFANISSGAVVNAAGIDVQARQNTDAAMVGITLGIGTEAVGAGISLAVAELHTNVLATSMGKLDARGGNVNVRALSRTGEPGEEIRDEDETARKAREAEERKKALESSLGDKLTKNTSMLTVGVAAGGGAGAGVAVSIGAMLADNVTRATLGAEVKNFNGVDVHAQSRYDNVLAATIGGGVGGIGAAASVAIAQASGTVQAKIDRSARISSGWSTNVSVTTDSVLGANAMATAIAAGGWEQSIAEVHGTTNAWIRTGDIKSVEHGDEFSHIASNRSNAYPRSECTGSDFAKAHRDERNSLYSAYDWCDFCHNTSTTGEDAQGLGAVTTTDISDALTKGFKKALAPLKEIQTVVAAVEGITKARYGEEENRAANAIYVLDLAALLARDVRLTELGAYSLWVNPVMLTGVTLLPNASRLYMGAGDRPQYIVDVLRGDALGEGREQVIEVVTALTGAAFAKPIIPFGSSGALDFATGTLTLPTSAEAELYLHEISAKWLIDGIRNGYLLALQAEQGEMNTCALDGGRVPDGELTAALTEDGETDGWKRYWFGATPETATDDQPLYCLLVNETTDEVDAFRTSRSMLNAGEAPTDLSLYLYRDNNADRREEEKYDVLFFDTPARELSLVKIMTDLPVERPLVLPKALRIGLRALNVEGADLPAYSAEDRLYLLNDGTDGDVNLFGGFYRATVDAESFESDYLRVEGLKDGSLSVTIKNDQPVWPERTGKDTAKDIAGNTYNYADGGWVSDGETRPAPADAETV